MENQNGRQALEEIRNQVLSQLSCLSGAPSVQMQEVPPDLMVSEEDEVRGNMKRGSASGLAIERSGADDAMRGLCLCVQDKDNPDERQPGRTKTGGEKPDHEAELYEGDKDQDQDQSA